MELMRFDDVSDFLAVAERFLVAREAEHNFLLGLTGVLAANPSSASGPAYLAVVSEGAAIHLAAIRLAPYGVMLSEALDPAAIGPLMADLAQYDRGLRGVSGPAAPAREFARLWTEATGQRAQLEIAERIYHLSSVRQPDRAVPGAWRLAEEPDLGLLSDWLVAFYHEAAPRSPQPVDPDEFAGRWVGPNARAGRAMYLWTAADRVVSMVGAGSPTPNGIRIGPVYTPPDERGRGYASALTAAASQNQLDRGRSWCFLLTDLANPTSNHIYQAIGYEPVSDVDQYLFVDRGSG